MDQQFYHVVHEFMEKSLNGLLQPPAIFDTKTLGVGVIHFLNKPNDVQQL
jgi:hypothetical protein